RVRAAGERRRLVVDEGDRRRALILRRALHGDNVRTSARLRDRDRDCVLKLQRRVIERGDRGPEGGASQSDFELDEILEVKRRVIGTAARDRGDKWRFTGSQIRREPSN